MSGGMMDGGGWIFGILFHSLTWLAVAALFAGGVFFVIRALHVPSPAKGTAESGPPGAGRG